METISNDFRLLETIENQDDFETLMCSSSDLLTLFDSIRSDLSPTLSEASLHNFLARISRKIVEKLCDSILCLTDIAVDACTPLDQIISKFQILEGYGQTPADDIRFMLRSSLTEIVGMWKTGETRLTQSQVRSLIRALFSNTDHRSTALAEIK